MEKKTLIATFTFSLILAFALCSLYLSVAEANFFPVFDFTLVPPIPGTIPTSLTLYSPQNNTIYTSSHVLLNFTTTKPIPPIDVDSGLISEDYQVHGLNETVTSQIPPLYSCHSFSLPGSLGMTDFSYSHSLTLSDGNFALTVTSDGAVIPSFGPGNNTLYYEVASSTVYFSVNSTSPSKQSALPSTIQIPALVLTSAPSPSPSHPAPAASSEGWIKTFTGVDAEDIIQSADGGYAIAGNLLLKTDSLGNMEWNQTYSGTALIQTFDGGFALTSGTQLVKTDASGNMEWNRTLWGGNYAFSLIQTSDGGYVITGVVGDPRYSQEYFWLTKTDELGLTKWSKTYENVMAGAAHSVIQTVDGGYAILGSSSNNPDFLLIKTNSTGNLEWSKTYGSQDMDFGDSIVQTNGGGYVLGGSLWNRTNPNNMAGLIKTDSNGNMQWENNYPGGTRLTLVNTTDGGYVLCSGLTLVKTDSQGNTQWVKGVGPDGQAHSVIQTRDGGYAIIGSGSLPGSGGQDWIFYSWIVKTDSEGNYPVLPSNSPSPSPSPIPILSSTMIPSESPTQQPTPELIPTPNNTKDNFTPMLIVIGLVITVVVMVLLIQIRRRRE